LKEEHELKLEEADVGSNALSFRNNPEYTLLSIMPAAKTSHYQLCVLLHTNAECIFEHYCSKNIELKR
jgi:hypothetical protein